MLFRSRFSYINTIKMVDNWLGHFEMEKQMKNEQKKQIDRHLEKIISDINSNKKWFHKDLFAVRLFSKKLLKSDEYAIGTGITDKCTVEDACTKCGICAKVCPANNIKVENSKPVFHAECLSCLACTQNCPQNAIRLSNEKSKVRFRNQHIKLNEIIESNNV